MAVIALIWANSPWAESYVDLWRMPISLGIGSVGINWELHFWINDFLMTFFFMAAGFEIRREMAEGELSDIRRGALPIVAAIGGMIIPASIYVAFNPDGPTAPGWGVPMATDIAFAVGILTLLGTRIPAALRILLLALAIIDDLGAILVIAIFYTDNFHAQGLLVVAGGMTVLLMFRTLGIRPGLVYCVPLFIIWAGLHEAGIHPTIAGVIVGMSAPVKPWLSSEQFLAISRGVIDDFSAEAAKGKVDEHRLLVPLRRLTVAGREAVAPVVRLQESFHPWVAYFIMPVFALANAGVGLGDVDFSDSSTMVVMLGVSLGLAVGKPVGIIFISWLAVRMHLAVLPRGVTWSGMLVMGLCAGIGFTMSIFIAGLAFADQPTILGVTKLSILIAAVIAGILAIVIGYVAMPRELAPK